MAANGPDIAGAAWLVGQRAQRYARLAGDQTALGLLYRLASRNPWACPPALAALERELAANPERAIGLDQDLFLADGRPAIAAGTESRDLRLERL